LIRGLPITGELLRGSLLERTVRHTKDCPKCARGAGHQVFVLTVTYPGGRTRQFSVRRERVDEVGRWLSNDPELKEAIAAVCELMSEQASSTWSSLCISTIATHAPAAADQAGRMVHFNCPEKDSLRDSHAITHKET